MINEMINENDNLVSPSQKGYFASVQGRPTICYSLKAEAGVTTDLLLEGQLLITFTTALLGTF